MEKLIINQLGAEDLRGRRVFVRIDADAELIPSETLIDPYKLRLSVPTLQHLLSAGARVIIGTHLGDPGGRPVDALRVDRVAKTLSLLMDKPVPRLGEVTGGAVLDAVHGLRDGEMLMLENLRFHPGEDANDDHFARELAQLCDVYCNDAFPLAHLGMASLVAITRHVRLAAAGLALAREVMMFETLLERPDPPFLGIIAGARIEEKLPILANVESRLNVLFVGGALSFTFLKAKGYQVGAAPVDEEFVPLVQEFLRNAKDKIEVFFPEDFIVVRANEFRDFQNGVSTHFPESWRVSTDDIRPTDLPVDIGLRTIGRLNDLIDTAHTILWNGPLGIWEIEPFASGTRMAARALIERPPQEFRGAVVCGDSLVRAIRASDLPYERIRHLTAAGEPALQLLAGNPLPAVAALDNASERMGPVEERILRLLLVVDESEGSRAAAGMVGDLIDADRMEINVLHVQKPAVSIIKALWIDPDKVRRIDIQRRFQAERVFMAINAALARRGLISHRQFVVQGDPVEEILKAADELDASVIAMAMSSVSHKVTNRSRHPVLVVRPPDEQPTLRKAG
jgi:phosphoglycerate kinase